MCATTLFKQSSDTRLFTLISNTRKSVAELWYEDVNRLVCYAMSTTGSLLYLVIIVLYFLSARLPFSQRAANTRCEIEAGTDHGSWSERIMAIY